MQFAMLNNDVFHAPLFFPVAEPNRESIFFLRPDTGARKRKVVFSEPPQAVDCGGWYGARISHRNPVLCYESANIRKITIQV